MKIKNRTLLWPVWIIGLMLITGGVALFAASGDSAPYLVVLGIAQDGGYPQAGCQKANCRRVYRGERAGRYVTSLAIVDPATRQRWFLDATPDFPEQLQLLNRITADSGAAGVAGIFLTHAHIGHYTGLMHLGREVMGAQGVPVYAMPRMQHFLRRNGPWNLLIELQNIRLIPLRHQHAVELTGHLKVTPFLVPHRDEFSETVGFLIQGPNRKVLYLPDIDKWERWDVPIEQMLAGVDVAFLDGTFYAEGELPGRSMADIPHPFIVESLKRFSALPASEKQKIRFIHLNHTNPALQPGSKAARTIIQAGFSIAEQGEKIGL